MCVICLAIMFTNVTGLPFDTQLLRKLIVTACLACIVCVFFHAVSNIGPKNPPFCYCFSVIDSHMFT